MLRSIFAASIVIICLGSADSAPAQNREGTYVYSIGDNASGEIKISTVDIRSFKFRIGIGSNNPACVGEFSNRAYWIAPNVAESQFSIHNNHSCRLIFVFSGNALVVKECECGNFHGASCDFEGTYSRTLRSAKSRKRP